MKYEMEKSNKNKKKMREFEGDQSDFTMNQYLTLFLDIAHSYLLFCLVLSAEVIVFHSISLIHGTIMSTYLHMLYI